MKKKILVVDDEKTIVELVRIRLEKNGYKVQTALSGKEALNVAQKEKPDLVILDIMMPEMDGYEVLKKLRGDLKLDMPVMLLTAKVADNDVWEGWQSGVDYYVTKPFTAHTLLRGVQLCLKQAS
ncbi:MAG: response regulator [Actinobacteria bacterium]|nr:MAG: response regulator [Actinomycetota bacterium]